MRTFIFFAILSIIFPVISMAQKAAWSVELHGGLPYNIPAPLVIKQNNEETIRLTAHYRSEPMIAPIYWTGRISRLQNNALWEFETIHHKLFLDNTPPEVQFFSITHGYNIITLSRSYIKSLDQEHSIVIRIGAGIVLSHPENKIRDKEIDPKGGIFKMGYYLTGPVLNLAVGNRFYITKRIFVNGEIKFNPSFSRVPIVDGYATLWNFPVAFIFGLGSNFQCP